MTTALMLWWSTNTRATSVLLHVALENGIQVGLVLDPHVPQPASAALGHCAVIWRQRRPLASGELSGLGERLMSELAVSRMVLAPTSEYIQRQVEIEQPPVSITTLPLRSRIPYQELTSKGSLATFTVGGRHLSLPETLVDPKPSSMPFVAKPRTNFDGDKPLSPFAVSDAASWNHFLAQRPLYYAQEYVTGPSVYWCGFRQSSGVVTWYTQENVLQVRGGGSVARAHLQRRPHSDLVRCMEEFMRETDFVGPLMAEFRGNPPKLIEINPRFWGPLLLDMQSGCRVLAPFFLECLHTVITPCRHLPPSENYEVPCLISSAVEIDDVFSLAGANRRTLSLGASVDTARVVSWRNDVLGGEW